MTDTTERAELLALADRIDIHVKHGTSPILEPIDVQKVASALRRLASQDQKPVAYFWRGRHEEKWYLSEWLPSYAHENKPLYLSPPPDAAEANASAEARLREALRDLVWLVSTDRAYDDSESLRSARNILFAENKAAMAALSAHSPAAAEANASAEARLREALGSLRRAGNSYYGKYIDKIESSCLGTEAKLKVGKFTHADLRAYNEAYEFLGMHRGILSAVSEIKLALSAHAPASDCDKQGCMGDMAPGDPKDLAELLAKPSVLEPSDRTADVTVEELHAFILKHSDEWEDEGVAARALLDAYTIGRR